MLNRYRSKINNKISNYFGRKHQVYIVVETNRTRNTEWPRDSITTDRSKINNKASNYCMERSIDFDDAHVWTVLIRQPTGRWSHVDSYLAIATLTTVVVVSVSSVYCHRQHVSSTKRVRRKSLVPAILRQSTGIRWLGPIGVYHRKYYTLIHLCIKTSICAIIWIRINSLFFGGNT